MKQKKNRKIKESEIIKIPNNLQYTYELQSQLINLRSNLDKVIKLINYHLN